MKTVKESLRSDRHALAVQIQHETTNAQDAIDCDDDAGIIEACQNMQNLMIELVASTVLDVRNKGE